MQSQLTTGENYLRIVELSPRGASCEPNHRFYGPVMEAWEAALESYAWL